MEMPMKRFDVNRKQRYVLIAVAILIIIIQTYKFMDEGVEGYGWVFSFCLIAAILYLAFSKDIYPSQTGTFSPPDSNNIKESYKSAAMHIIQIRFLVKSMNKDMFHRTKDLLTNKGPLSVVHEKLANEPIMLYAFSIFTICKLKHNPEYLSSKEHNNIREYMIKDLALSEFYTLSDMNTGKPDEFIISRIIDGISEEVKVIENGVVKFARELQDGDTTHPSKLLNDWFTTKVGWTDIHGVSLDNYYREKIKVMYHVLYNPPSNT
jgi:hypothetical protein